MTEKHSNVLGKLARGLRTHKGMSIVVVALVLTGLLTWRIDAAKSKSGGLLTQEAAYGDITDTVSASATVEPVNQAEAQLSQAQSNLDMAKGR